MSKHPGRLIIPRSPGERRSGVIVSGSGGGGSAYSGIVKPPSYTALTQVNAGTTTFGDDPDGFWMQQASHAGSDTLALLLKALPTTKPYTLTVGIRPVFFPLTPSAQYGLVLRNSSSGLLDTNCVKANGSSTSIFRVKWNNPTAWNSDGENFNIGHNGIIFLRFFDDNINRFYQIAQDPNHFVTWLIKANTDFVVPDQWGVYMDANCAQPISIKVFHWAQTP